MSDSQLGSNQPIYQKPSGVSQSLPLVPHPTLPQGSASMTRLGGVSQGVRIPGRPLPNNGVTDNSMMAALLNQTNNHPNLVNSLSATNMRKRKLPNDDYVVLRRKVSENHYTRLKRLQVRYAEHVALLCFLQSNGHQGDYCNWRTRLPPVPLNNFLKSHKLNPNDEKEDLYTVLENYKTILNSSSSPAKPTMVSSGVQNDRLPQASLTSTPMPSRVPHPHTPVGRPPATPTQKNMTPSSHGTSETSSGSSNQEQQIVEKAKQEAYVMQRVGELQKDGLWAEKRLPKVHELPRAKAHWDYLLEEMTWLAADFAQERKWKKAAAKKCARMVQKYFQEKEAMKQKAIKAQEMQLRKIASFIAREVKQFWGNVEKLVEFKQQTRLEEKRKKALDQHLSFIVDQTEKYSSLVAESMNTSVPSPKNKLGHSDDEFEPDGPSEDDEETIAKEEALSASAKENVDEEINQLKRESELPLEDLLSDYLQQREQLDSSRHSEDDNGDGDFQASGKESSDDEETIQEQEQAEGKVDYGKELKELEDEGNMNIEELKAKYGIASTAQQNANKQPQIATIDLDSDDDSDEEDTDGDEDMDVDEPEIEEASESSEEELESEEENDKEQGSALKSLINDGNPVEISKEDKDREINDVAAIAQSLQPKGNTLSSTSVVTKVPFLLKHSLREYQHIGLDWLVTMYDRKLNGILADEMGLGKTIQTIALLAHLACEKGNWGPHLIVVPTSVMLNWEMEIKKWCPGFKILTYYGTQKERKLKRSGWTKPNAFHICVTSYKLVIQDHQSFRRKKWKYLILDEAQNIKNFKSQRWQLLLNFQTQRRLLLTGTPLQNDLMELWSLMHFLMPDVFESHREFKEWFSNPVTGMIEGSSEYNESIIKRLHKVLRPFLLRRLKCEVETQMPKKYEHVVMCRLSNRQRYLYDDFMSRAKTKETLATGNLLSVINVLMQLRKVCNHPNLFEVRPTVSPFQMEKIVYPVPSLVWNALNYDPFKNVDLGFLNLLLVEFELWLLAFVAHRAKRYKIPSETITHIDSAPPEPPACPKSKVRLNLTKRNTPPVQNQVVSNNLRQTIFQVGGTNRKILTPICTTKVGTSPLMKSIIGSNSNQGVTLKFSSANAGGLSQCLQLLQQPGGVKAISLASSGQMMKTGDGTRIVPQLAQLVNTPSGRQLVLSPPVISSQAGGTVVTASGQRLVLQKAGNVTKLINPIVTQLSPVKPTMKVPPLNISTSISTSVVQHNSISSSLSAPVSSSNSSANTSVTTATATASATSTSSPSKNLRSVPSKSKGETSLSCFKDVSLLQLRKKRRQEKLALLARVNERRIQAMPIYGVDLVGSVSCKNQISEADWRYSGYVNCRKSVKPDPRNHWEQTEALQKAIYAVEDRVVQLSEVFSRFVLCVPAVAAPLPAVHVAHPSPWKETLQTRRISVLEKHLKPKFNLLHPISSAMSTLFPDPRLIQYDCGKLQSLDRLLRQLKTDHHRVLIFTQMTRMLDVLEAFLNFHGHIYLRLDGTTKVDQRQVLMERFNGDKRIFCFILSTRSGGVGINLTGADTVIFYDSDWNPTMDAQAQDRCHRIGQTRDVHIYRLISEKTVEENILKKANQKRMLGDLAIEGGNFTTAYFKTQTTIQDIFNVDVSENDASRRMAEVLRKDNDTKEETPYLTSGEEKTSLGILENALAQAEDDTDVAAAKVAKAEAAAELAEFDENIPIDSQEPELSKAEQELNALMQQLSGVEKYAMNFVERSESVWSAERLAAAEAEIEMQKKEWEKGRMATVKEEDRKKRAEEAENEDIITYSATDARNQVWMSNDGMNILPIWGPPTPPQGEGDVYINHNLELLYEPKIIPTELLPPVYIKKEKKRTRVEAGLPEGRVPTKIRQRDDSLMHVAPRSLFDRPSPALIKMRQEMRYHRHRGTPRPIATLIKPTVPVKHPPEPDYIPDWTIQEDYTILQAIQNIQELTLNLIVLSPGHTPNWDLVADMVNHTSRTYRSPKQCKNRYESVIILREEGKLLFDNQKKKKKNNPPYKLPLQMKTTRPLKTAQLYGQDNNVTMTQIMNARFEAIRTISSRRAPTTKPLLVNAAMKNPTLSEVLSENSIDSEAPLTPVQVASKRADRIAKEKAMSVRGIAVTPEQHIAAIRLQQQQLRATAVKTTTVTTPTVTSTVTLATSSSRPVAVQEIMASPVVRAVASSPTTQTVATPPRGTVANVVSVQSSSTPLPKGTKTISPAQLQIYRQQHLFRQQQQLRVLQSRPPAQKVSVAVASSTPTARVQQVQVKASGLTRTVSESEMLALLKRQQVTKVSTNTTIASAQLLAQATLQAQQQQQAQQSGSSGVGQVTTLVKTVSAASLPVAGLLPQVKAALGAGLKPGTVTSQQIRQLSIQQQLISQQRKFPQQKVTQIGQVTTKGVGTAQLILQSQKPTTMTMQQIQQVMKQVPQHVVKVAQVSTGQVIPHSVFTKAQSSSQPRVIPVATSSQQPIKQAIQVVSASSAGATRAIPSVTIDASGRTAASIAGALKSGTASQQAILTQVSAVLQQGQPVIRQPVRIQTTSSPIVAVAVSQAPTLLTLPPQDNNQPQ